MNASAVALLSGSLDSMLAVRVVQQQGFAVEGLYFQRPCHDHLDRARHAADSLGVPLTVISADAGYLALLRQPAHGFGRGANPCLDCRIHMFRAAEAQRVVRGAALVISGEVLGQHPMTQKRRDLDLIAQASNLEGRLLRPLSAALLRPTIGECEGLIDRTRLYGFSGRSRRPLRELAARLNLSWIPDSSPGCALAEPSLAGRVRELLACCDDARLEDLELLKIGRHSYFSGRGRVVLGRREEENRQLAAWFHLHQPQLATLMVPEDFAGPTALVIGSADEAMLAIAIEQIGRRCAKTAGNGRLRLVRRGGPDEIVALQR